MILEASSVEKWYLRGKGSSNRFFAVQSTDLTLQPGQLTVLMGRSGSGKTTLLHMMAGLLKPDGGKVLADGADLYAMQDEDLARFRNLHFGMIPQGADLLPELTVRENILLPQGIYRSGGQSPDDLQNRFDRLGISQLPDTPAKELSGGERRRVCIIRALAGNPAVVFADEPTSDLDDESMITVLQMLREAADAGAAVFIVTHDSEALDYADRSFRMNSGVME